VRKKRAESVAILRQNPTKAVSRADVDEVLSKMAPSTRKKLANSNAGAVVSCPECAKVFVQPVTFQRFCSRKCRQLYWRKTQAAYLARGRQIVDAMAREGLNTQTLDEEIDADKAYLDAIFDRFDPLKDGTLDKLFKGEGHGEA
jgi:hypothetical protein